MATISGMSSVDVRAEVQELVGLLPLWVGKIYQYDNDSFGFRLNGEEKARHLLFCVRGIRIHRVSELPPAPKNPSGFSMYLRKFIEGGKILSIRQKGIERVIVITIGKGSNEYKLIIELFDEGNLILTDKDNVILNALAKKRFKERNIVSGAVYNLSAIDIEKLSYEEFVDEIHQETENDLVRTLAVRFKLGGVASEEICEVANVSKNLPVKFATDAQLKSLYASVVSWLKHPVEPVIVEKGASPFVSAFREPKQRFTTFSEALEAFYPKPEIKQEVEKKEHLSKKERIRRQQEEAIVSFEKKIASATEAVEMIYTHYREIQEIIQILFEASKKMSWQEIGMVLKATDIPAAKSIVSINAKDASVLLNLGEKQNITIFINESLEANAGRYSMISKKFKEKKVGALRALEKEIVHTEKKIEHSAGKLKKKWYYRFRWMKTSDGVLLIGGKNADQNEELVKKYMEGKDIFLHADVFGASVILVKGPTGCMNEAVQFAASYSRLWSEGVASGNVIEALPSQVSKTPESGEYVAHGSFLIRGKRILHRNVPLEVAIGIMTEPILEVIGGTPSAVEPKTKVSVRLHPGIFEGNDIAKKVLRKLRDAFSESEQKALKNVLNTDAIATFVPPGGSV
ncbi:MAG TPA: ribosome rescue protein RqcH, partial [Methanocorpusculum sp.]|nr:ribosome rescue protein RqcH [Methanocorpusculum sp.]